MLVRWGEGGGGGMGDFKKWVVVEMGGMILKWGIDTPLQTMLTPYPFLQGNLDAPFHDFSKTAAPYK